MYSVSILFITNKYIIILKTQNIETVQSMKILVENKTSNGTLSISDKLIPNFLIISNKNMFLIFSLNKLEELKISGLNISLILYFKPF